ncbi:MAG: DciA family protein [Myxococcota bacterium]
MSKIKTPGTLPLAAPLQQLIDQSQAFEPKQLQQALGTQLWQLCQPIGFVDPKCHIVMLNVASSCAAMEVSLRKPEILQQLRQLQPFAQVRDIRLRIQPDTAQPTD